MDQLPPDHSPDLDGPVVTRSEEQLRISGAVRVRGGLRLSKTVVTETVTQTVQIRRERLVVEELAPEDVAVDPRPAGGPGHGPAGGELVEDDFEIILHEERVVLTTRIVPVERVRVRTRIVTEQRDVSAAVEKEQVEIIDLPASPH